MAKVEMIIHPAVLRLTTWLLSLLPERQIPGHILRLNTVKNACNFIALKRAGYILPEIHKKMGIRYEDLARWSVDSERYIAEIELEHNERIGDMAEKYKEERHRESRRFRL